MQKYLLICILFTVLSGFKTCPEFDRNLLLWQPYVKGDLILFESAYDDSVQFRIESHQISGGERYKGKCDCVCKVESQISAVSTKDSSIYFNYIINSIKNNQFILEINHSFFSCFPDLKNKTYHIEYFKYNMRNKYWESNDMHMKTQDLSGNEYSNVIEIEIDTVIYDNYPIYKVFIAENRGLVAFIEKDSKQTYYLK